MTNTILENEDKIKELHRSILKMQTDLEQQAASAYAEREEIAKDMMNGEASMQQTIIDAIRQRYQTEWELMQEDLEKKREALDEEIAMIDERLQKRKDAEDEADKYEELAELQRQLALISLDSTRTKDQMELREQIAELEKEIAWDIAEDEAEAVKEGLQEQSDAYSEYEEEYQEWLDDYLEDTNNFSDEVNRVLKLGQEEMIEWLKRNNEEYKNSFGAMQEEMIAGWEETYRQMKHIVITYWDEVMTALNSKESFIELMKQTDAYVNASEAEKE